MQIRGRDFSFCLLVAKLLKVLRIRLAFVWPTIKARIILRLMECPYGQNLKVCGKVYFRPNGKDSIRIGNEVIIIARFLTNTVGITNPGMLECIQDGKIEIGDHVGLTSAVLSARKMIQVGKNVNIGANVRIFDHDFHSLDHKHRRKGGDDFAHVETAAVIIDDDVFIGTNAMILKGVHIGARSVIAAGSVVTLQEIPEDALVAGNPAKIIHRINHNAVSK
jgi:acetyltransferase-like isoleucine patch superfamily enzyme